MNILVSGKSYLTEFDCKVYLNSFFSTTKGNPHEKGLFPWIWIQAHRFYDKYNSKWNNKAARLLEFGGGPVIATLISAVPYVDQITFAAYTDGERKEIELWLNNKEGAHDWSAHFKYILREVERNIDGDATWQKREELLRKRMSNVIPCDILCDNPLLVKQEPFEIVSTSLCLEAACTTFEEYKRAVKKLVGLLKPGGFLLMYIVERQTFYMVGEKKWFCLYLTLEQVKEALTEARTATIVVERDPAPMEQIQSAVVSDYKAVLFVAAQKVEF